MPCLVAEIDAELCLMNAIHDTARAGNTQWPVTR
jgi:hypothetical protein